MEGRRLTPTKQSPVPTARSWWGQLFDIRGPEWPKALGLAAFFFLVIAIFWVLKPIKRGLFLAFYDGGATLGGWHAEAAELEQVGKVVTMVAVIMAAAAFTWLVRRLPRRYIIVTLCGAFAVALGGFAWMIDTPTPALAWSFYVFGDVFNTMMVGAFWAFANDLVHSDQAKRLYGVVGLGGVLGGLFGATVVNELVAGTGRAPLLGVCMLALGGIAWLTLAIERHAERQGAVPGLALRTGEARSRFSGLLEGIVLTVRSRYLLSFAGLVAIYEIVSNIVDFQLSAVVQTSVAGNTDKDAFFALVGQVTGLASIVVQLFFTSWVMRRLGVGAALLVLPVVVLGGAAGFLVFPTLIFAAAMSASDNALHYSIDQSAKETLYVPTTRNTKYKAKAVIDMVVQRVAKVLAVAINLGMAAWVGVGGVRWLSLVTAVFIVLWIYLARSLGRAFEAREADARVPEPAHRAAGAQVAVPRAGYVFSVTKSM